jgi:hypothetical protein
MKTKKNLFFMIIAAVILNTKNSSGQNKQEFPGWNKDHLFPVKGRTAVSAFTGIPYKGSVEFVYGFSKHFSAGMFFGLPFSGANAYGIRLRRIIFSSDNGFRVYAESPVIYYPETAQREAWFFLYPGIMTEKRFKSGVRLAAGAGLPSGGCMDALLGGHEIPHAENDKYEGNEKKSVFGADEEIMGGLWYTLNTAIAFPVTKRVMFSLRLDFIVDGIKIKNISKKEWFYKPGIIMITGFTFSL